MWRKIITIKRIVIAGLLFKLGELFIQTIHWFSINFDMRSYNPFILLVAWPTVITYFIMNWKTRAHYYYWLFGTIMLCYILLMTLGIFKTYGVI